MLKMLPTELIAFGKLQPASASAATAAGTAAQLGSRQQMQAAAGSEKDVLHIGINGLHRWTAQFENHIWKHLGKSTLQVHPAHGSPRIVIVLATSGS